MSSAHQSRSLRVEGPPVDQGLHRDRIVTGSQTMVEVETVGFGQSLAVEFDSEAGLLRNSCRMLDFFLRWLTERLAMPDRSHRDSGGG